LSITEALMIEPTLNAEQINTTIASAPERARCVDWAKVLDNAANFQAGRKAEVRPILIEA
jgi:hypothetical protein